jgi:hypothetical protein
MEKLKDGKINPQLSSEKPQLGEASQLAKPSTAEGLNSEQGEALNSFYNFFQIFIGVISNETKKIFTKTDAIYIPHDPIIDHGDFYQTTLLWKQMAEHLEKIAEILAQEDMMLLTKQIEHIDKIFNGVVNISKKMYNQSDFYFVYAEGQRYTDRKEFVDIFKNNVYFLSNGNKDYAQPQTRQPENTLTRQPSTKIPTRNL